MSGEGAPRESEVRIRRMGREDIPAAERLLQESPEAAGWSESALRNSLDSQSTLALISEKGNELAGLIVGRRIGDEGEILNLAVKPAYRRVGIGRRLVKSLVAQWQKEKTGKIFLEVRASNEGAIKLYDGLGFREIGRRAGYYNHPVEDALVLAWSLR